jgi:hypothetical protein
MGMFGEMMQVDRACDSQAGINRTTLSRPAHLWAGILLKETPGFKKTSADMNCTLSERHIN